MAERSEDVVLSGYPDKNALRAETLLSIQVGALVI